MATELYIDGKLCDLEKKEVIAMSYGVNRLTDIESRQGFYSNTFKLPLTANNLGIFGIPTELNSSDTTRWERLECVIITDGIYQVFGFAQLQSLQDDLSVVVKGGNATFIDDIRDLELEDLDLSEHNHQITLANVEANRFNDYTDSYVYPDVDYNYLNTIENPIPYWFLFPGVYAYEILSKIVTGAGYTLLGDITSNPLFRKMVVPFSREYPRASDAFRDGQRFRANLKPAILIYTGLDAPPANSSAEYFRYVAGFDNDSTGGYFDNSGDFTTGNWAGEQLVIFPTELSYYQPSIVFDQSLRFDCRIVVTGWTVGCRLSIALTGNIYSQWSNSVYTHETEANSDGTFDISLELFQDDLPNLGGRNMVRVILDGITSAPYTSGSASSHPNAPTVEFVSGVMYNDPNNTYNYANEFEMAANLPDMKQTDFIKYIVNAFSLLIVTNKELNTVSFELFDDLQANGTDDWSSKIDLTEEPTIEPKYGNYLKNNIFKYGNNKSDKSIKLDPEYGQHNVIRDVAPKGIKTVYSSAFSASKPLIDYPSTMFIHYFDGETFKMETTAVSNGAEVTVLSTDRISEGDEIVFVNLNGSLLYDGDSVNGKKGLIVREITSQTVFDIQGSFTGGVATSGEFIVVKSPRKTKDPKPRVAIHDVINGGDVGLLQLIGGTTVTQRSRLTFTDIEFKNLIDAYGSTIVSFILTPQMVKMLMRLSAVDINQIDFSKPKWIDLYNCYFYLSFVNQYKVNQVDSTEVELIKLP